MRNVILLFLLCPAMLYAQTTGSFTDSRDGKTYKTITIGNQVWMAENLNYKTPSGSWCYDNDSANCAKFGRLYNWETAKKVAPAGWHLPSKAEYETLLKTFGGDEENAYKQFITGGKSGFNALEMGWRIDDGSFDHAESDASFFSSTESDNEYAWSLLVSGAYQKAVIYDGSKISAFSVRLVKD